MKVIYVLVWVVTTMLLLYFVEDEKLITIIVYIALCTWTLANLILFAIESIDNKVKYSQHKIEWELLELKRLVKYKK